MTLSCSNCGKELPDDAKFCMECGTEVAVQTPKQEYHFCSYCGYELAEDAKFCLHCGRAIVEEPAKKEKDKLIYSELYTSSPYYRFQADPHAVLDFEEHKPEAKQRAERWAEYIANDMRFEDWLTLLRLGGVLRNATWIWWNSESEWFPTNKPNAHEALYIKASMEWFIREARRRGYIDYQGNFGQQVHAYYKKQHDWTDEDLSDFRLDEAFILKSFYPELDELAKKDDELFPPPQPLRVEVASAILNFMSDEGVFVVYVDCSHAGKRVGIEIEDKLLSSAYSDQRQAEILERSGSGTPICAAIFNHIPFVTDEHRNRQEVLKQLQVSVQCNLSTYQKWEDKVTIFQGQVTELDWCNLRLSSRHDPGLKYGIEHRSTPCLEARALQIEQSPR